ncbi:hypothetical protein ACFVG1_13300 [Streptomyces bacillaris]|uniref:hypothetical protein n=1 Tax=Streptomyces bacillaris TaxID=68179 RepID=UPI0035D5E34D
MPDTTPTPADRPADQLRALIAEALLGWAETNSSPQYARMRRPETVVANAYGRADAVLAALPAPALAVARQLLGTSTGEDTDAAELTAEEARDLVDELNTELYQARDALAFVGECCDIADRNQRPITTGDVREWLKGARCGRQLLGTNVAESAAAALEPQDHPGADLFVALRAAGLDVDEAHRRIHAYAAMVLRQEKALAAPPAPADRAAVLREAADAVDNTEFPDEYVDLFDNGARWASRLLCRLAADAAAGVQPPTEGETTRSYRLEHRLPGDTTWQRNTPGIGANWSWQSREKAEQRLAEARNRWPDFEHRLIEKTTTVTEQPAAPAAPEEQR